MRPEGEPAKKRWPWTRDNAPAIPEEFGGRVDIGHVIPISREGLINEWKSEFDFYSTYLGASGTTPGSTGWNDIDFVSGAVERRFAQSLGITISGGLNGPQGKLDDARVGSELDRIDRQQDISNEIHSVQLTQVSNQLLSAQIEQQKLMNELAAIRRAKPTETTITNTATTTPATAPTAGGGPATEASSFNVNSGDARLKAITDRMKELNANTQAVMDKLIGTGSALGRSERTKGGLAVPSSVQGLSVDKVRDIEALRNAIIAVRRKRMLDESHDGSGQTLRHFMFRFNFEPPPEETRSFRIEVKLTPQLLAGSSTEKSAEARRREFAPLINALVAQLREEWDTWRERLEQRQGIGNPAIEARLAEIEAGIFAEEPKPHNKQFIDQFQKLQRQASPGLIQPSTVLPEGADPAMAPSSSVPPPLGGKDFETSARKLATAIILTRYIEFQDLFELDFEEMHKAGGVFRLKEKLLPPRLSLSAFLDRIFEQHPSLAKDYCNVLSLEPSEYAQNISNVGAQDNMFSLALSAAAAPGGGAALGGQVDYLRRYQEFLETITRKPLARGFLSGERDASYQCGWILGPRFEIHTPPKASLFNKPKPEMRWVQEGVTFDNMTFTATTPALAKNLKVNFNLVWLKPDGKADEQRNAPHTVERTVSLAEQIDYPSFFRGVVEDGRGTKVGPLIKPSAVYEVRGAGGVQLAIRGQGLWRNPQAYLDGVPASGYTLMSDMKGIVVQFAAAPTPYHKKATLTVVTTEGQDTLEDAVFIIGGTDSTSEPVLPPKPRNRRSDPATYDYKKDLRENTPIGTVTKPFPLIWDYRATDAPFSLHVELRGRSLPGSNNRGAGVRPSLESNYTFVAQLRPDVEGSERSEPLEFSDQGSHLTLSRATGLAGVAGFPTDDASKQHVMRLKLYVETIAPKDSSDYVYQSVVEPEETELIVFRSTQAATFGLKSLEPDPGEPRVYRCWPIEGMENDIVSGYPSLNGTGTTLYLNVEGKRLEPEVKVHLKWLDMSEGNRKPYLQFELQDAHHSAIAKLAREKDKQKVVTLNASYLWKHPNARALTIYIPIATDLDIKSTPTR